MKRRKFVNAGRCARSAQGWLYGRHVVEAWLHAQPSRLRRVVLSGRTTSLTHLADLSSRSGLSVEMVSDEQLIDLTSTSRHQGIAALAREFPYVPVDSILRSRPHLMLIVDRIQDPRNLGAILRTAAAIGVGGVVLPKDRATGITATVEASAAGAAARLPVSRVTNVVQAAKAMKGAGYWLVGLDARAEMNIFELAVTEPTGIVVGGEAGIRQLLLRTCDHVVSIPMPGSVESLNVSVATAVALYELCRQRHKWSP